MRTQLDDIADPAPQTISCRTPEEALAVMDAAWTIAISGHVNPDGDALGSALALRDLLKTMGKNVTLLLGQESPAPKLYNFLPDYEFANASEYIGIPDLYIVVDASTIKRLGTAEELFKVSKDTLVIDHHTNGEDFARHYYGDVSAPATSSLIWRIIKASKIQPTLNMALYCYVGIMTDTGRFAFKNTDRTAFADAMEMVDIGVNPAVMSQLVYENKTLAALRLEALIIDRLQFASSGRAVYSYILQKDLSSLGLERDATEQLPTILRTIEDVEVAVLFRDEKDEGVRVNLRSKSTYDVSRLACMLGGGGHIGAAGLTLIMPLEDSIALVMGHLERDLSGC